MMTEIHSCILSQYLRYNENIQVEKSSVRFLKVFPKNINYPSNFLVTIVPLKNGTSLRENATYMKVIIFNGYN